MPLSAGSPRVVRYVFWGDQWCPLRTDGQMGELMEWARILAYISWTLDQELLLRNEYLAAENQILRGQLKGRPAGYHSGMVPKARRAQVRWLEASKPRPTPGREGN